MYGWFNLEFEGQKNRHGLRLFEGSRKNQNVRSIQPWKWGVDSTLKMEVDSILHKDGGFRG